MKIKSIIYVALIAFIFAGFGCQQTAKVNVDKLETLADSNIDFTILFYNPNIHPRDEYETRKGENIRFAKKMNIPIVDGDYNQDDWFKRAKGMEQEPERGKRCTMCFDMRR